MFITNIFVFIDISGGIETEILVCLQFLYSDEVSVSAESVLTVLYTAKKYAVPTLEEHCVAFLKDNLTAENAFLLLSQARLFDEPQLAALCLDCIDKLVELLSFVFVYLRKNSEPKL